MSNPFAWTEFVCPIAALSEEERSAVVWEMTCFPADFEHTCEQLCDIARKLNAGVSLDAQREQNAAEMDRKMAAMRKSYHAK